MLLEKYKKSSEDFLELQTLKTGLKTAKVFRYFWIFLIVGLSGAALFLISLYNVTHQLIDTKGTWNPHIYFDLFLLVLGFGLVWSTLLEKFWVQAVIKRE